MQLEDYEDVEQYKSTIINVLQDIMEIITQDVMNSGHEWVQLLMKHIIVYIYLLISALKWVCIC